LYRAAIEPIRAHLEAGAPADQLDSYAGTGSWKHTFLADGPTGRVAVKFLHGGDRQLDSDPTAPLLHRRGNEPLDPQLMTKEIAPLIAGEAMEGDAHEKLLAVVPEEGYMVTTAGEGYSMYNIPNKVIRGISAQDIIKLDETRRRMAKDGLHPHNIGSVLYAPDGKGFNFVDYAFENYHSNKPAMSPVRGTTKSFLEYVLDDWSAINKAQEGFDWDMYDRKYNRPKDPNRSWMRMHARSKVLTRLGKIGLDE
jgi:hypothetical protein